VRAITSLLLAEQVCREQIARRTPTVQGSDE
jgi:hypothetical protein